MAKAIILLVLIFVSNTSLTNCQETKKASTVINMLGAKVYEQATFNSKVVSILQVGETIIKEDSVETLEEFEIGPNFSLSGKWIKPEGVQGFIFSSDLTEKQIKVLGKKGYGMLINLYGALKSEDSEKRIVKTGEDEHTEFVEYYYFQNADYTITVFDGCFNRKTEFKNLKINEVYHQLVSGHGVWGEGGDFLIPVFQERFGNSISFEGKGLTEQLKIEIKEDGEIIVSSYECT